MEGLFLVFCVLEDRLGGLDDDAGVVIDRAGQEGVAADDGVVSDDRLSAEDRRTGVDRHVVADGRVALAGERIVPRTRGERAERHTLIELDVVADVRRLADDDAGAVVNEEVRADLRAGVDVDAGVAVGCLLYTSRCV